MNWWTERNRITPDTLPVWLGQFDNHSLIAVADRLDADDVWELAATTLGKARIVDDLVAVDLVDMIQTHTSPTITWFKNNTVRREKT